MFASLKEFWQLARFFKDRLAVVSALLALDALLTATSVITVAPLTDLLLEKPPAEWLGVSTKLQSVFHWFGLQFTVVSVAVLFFLLTLGMTLFSVFVRWSLVKLRIAVIRHLIDQSLTKMFAADWNYFASTKRGLLINTYVNEVNISGAAFQSLTLAVASIVRIVAFIAVPLVLAPTMVLSCLVAAVILLLPFMYIGKWSFKFGTSNVSFANRYAALFRESIEAAHEVISFGRERTTIKQINHAYQQYGDSRVKAETFSFFASQMYEPMGILVIMTALVVATRSSEGLALSSVAVVLWGLVRTIGPLKQLIQLKHNVDNKLPSLRQILGEQQRAESMRQTNGNCFNPQTTWSVQFDQVGFRYQDGTAALTDCSFSASNNQMVALVGESGSGKSTIIDLILGLQRPELGRVLLNGVDTDAVDLQQWRKGIAVVPQSPVLFDLSVRDNILWANPDASDAEIWRVCAIAGAREFVEQMPNGLDTEIGDSGVRLSGGQVQRLALARALIRKPALLILDEATSALDMETEAHIYKELAKETRDCLVIVVAHRLSTISGADNILVFQRGQLIEQGDHDALLAQQGYFYRLLNAQPGAQAA